MATALAGSTVSVFGSLFGAFLAPSRLFEPDPCDLLTPEMLIALSGIGAWTSSIFAMLVSLGSI